MSKRQFLFGASSRYGLDSDDSEDSTYSDPDGLAKAPKSKHREVRRGTKRTSPPKKKKATGKFRQQQKQMTGENLFTRLPLELVVMVLARVPSSDRIQCARVCREWNHLLATTPEIWTDLDLSRGGPGNRGVFVLTRKSFTNIVKYTPLCQKINLSNQSQIKLDVVTSHLRSPAGQHVTHVDLTGWRNVSERQLSRLVPSLTDRKDTRGQALFKGLVVPDYDRVPLLCSLPGLFEDFPHLEVLDCRGLTCVQQNNPARDFHWPNLKELRLNDSRQLRKLKGPYSKGLRVLELGMVSIERPDSAILKLIHHSRNTLEELALRFERNPWNYPWYRPIGVENGHYTVDPQVDGPGMHEAPELSFPNLKRLVIAGTIAITAVVRFHAPKLESLKLLQCQDPGKEYYETKEHELRNLGLLVPPSRHWKFGNLREFASESSGLGIIHLIHIAMLCPRLQVCDLVSERNLPRPIRRDPLGFIRYVQSQLPDLQCKYYNGKYEYDDEPTDVRVWLTQRGETEFQKWIGNQQDE